MSKNIFEYYREQRPNLFSDSRVEYKAVLTKELFRSELAKLSTDMRQDLFENFTGKLVIRLITPNIIPAVGPNGGGDGGVDIRTHSVSEEIAAKWYYQGEGCHGTEKWAFAVSCKADWKSKINSDIKKIAELQEGYTKIFFCTNQSVQSKEKSYYYHKFKLAYNIDVEILDEKWYIQAVFDNQMIDIAVEELNLSSEYKEKTIHKGPNDVRLEAEEVELEEKIRNYIPEPGLNIKYIQSLLRSAIISRTLGNARRVVEGKFQRALRECERYGNIQLKYQIIYNQGWTDFFWYEDIDGLRASYEMLKEIFPHMVSVDSVESLLNLQMNIRNAHSLGLCDDWDAEAEDAYNQELYEKLKDEYSSSALYLRIYILNIQLQRELRNNAPTLTETLIQLFEAIKESRHHAEISFESLCDVIELEGQYIQNSPIFEDIVEEITDILAERQKEVAGGMTSLKRAIANVEAGNYQYAIRHLSKCIIAFQKEGYETELVKSYGFMGMAYYNLNMPYAARVFLIGAMSFLFRQYYKQGAIDHLLITVVDKLCEIELLLGRLVMFWNWHEILQVFSGHPSIMPESEARDKFYQYDSLWACRLADASNQSSVLEKLPDILQRCGMEFSANVVWQSLGYTENLTPEMSKFIGVNENWRAMFLGQPLMKQLLAPINISSGDELRLETTIKSCKFEVQTSNTPLSQLYAEMILGYVEMFISIWEAPKDAILTTNKIKFIIQFEHNAEIRIENDWATHQHTIHADDNDKKGERLWEKLPEMLVSTIMSDIRTSSSCDSLNYEEILKALSQRAYACASYIDKVNSVLGVPFKSRVEDWARDTDTVYVKKTEDSHQEEFNSSANNQTEIVPVINTALWDRAKWQGCGFIYDRFDKIFYLALLFENFDYGKRIFDEWKSMPNLPIKITFITKFDREHMSWYRAVVSLDPKRYIELTPNSQQRYVAISSRIHTMTPTTSQNMEMFCQYFERYQQCQLIPVKVQNNSISMESFPPEGIRLESVEFREAWTIGEKEMMSVAILKGDKPYIPDGMENEAPVLPLLKKRNGEREDGYNMVK